MCFLPSLSPLVTAGLFSVSVNLFAIYIHLYYFSDSTCKWYTEFVFIWLTSLCILLSRFTYLLQMAVFHSFLWWNNIPLCVYIKKVCVGVCVCVAHIFLIQLLMSPWVASRSNLLVFIYIFNILLWKVSSIYKNLV